MVSEAGRERGEFATQTGGARWHPDDVICVIMNKNKRTHTWVTGDIVKANACTDCASNATNDTRASIPELDIPNTFRERTRRGGGVCPRQQKKKKNAEQFGGSVHTFHAYSNRT